MPCPLPRRAIALAIAVLALCPPTPTIARAEDEGRALWVVRTTLVSPKAIATMVDAARAGGFNTLLVQIRGRGDAYYRGGREPRASALAAQPAFDPLADTITRAHEAGLRVHAWVNVNLVASANELPSARDHVVGRHPEWLMVPRALAAELDAADPKRADYVDRLARYVRGQPTQVEGLYLSPAIPAAADYTVSVVDDIVRRYAVDGVHLDYVRYPNPDFDYSRGALEAFRSEVAHAERADVRRRLDRDAARDPLAYTTAFPDRWRAFRAARMTDLMARLRDAVKRARPDATVSAAVAPDAAEALTGRLQDWREWVARDLVDVVCPMAYTADARVFAAEIAADRALAGTHPVWAGIGAYRLSPAEIVENVQTARRLGVGGIILFSYESLTDSGRGAGRLTEVGRAAFSSSF
jgi:uncharacterized lipoprotein YddW (UPF0748 family)